MLRPRPPPLFLCSGPPASFLLLPRDHPPHSSCPLGRSQRMPSCTALRTSLVRSVDVQVHVHVLARARLGLGVLLLLLLLLLVGTLRLRVALLRACLGRGLRRGVGRLGRGLLLPC